MFSASSSMSSPSSNLQIWGWEAFFEEIDSFILASGRQFGQCTESYAHHTLERLGVFVTTLTRLMDHIETNVGQVSLDHRAIVLRYTSQIRQLIDYLRSLTGEWQSYIDVQESQAISTKYQASVSQSGKGQSRFLVPKEQLEYLYSICFTWTDIAHLSVSRMTIYRRREEYGMLNEPVETLSDSELRQKVLEVKRMLPQVGESIMLGQLKSMGYKVTRWHVREALQSTDPVNVALRWPGGTTARRQYSVPGPNSLWHIGM